MARKPYKYQDYIDTIEHLVEVVNHDLQLFEDSTMHNADNCIMTKIYGCFEGGMKHYFNLSDLFDPEGESAVRSLTNGRYLVEALFGMDEGAEDFVEGLVLSSGTEDFDEFESTIDGPTWINNANLIIGLLKDIG